MNDTNRTNLVLISNSDPASLNIQKNLLDLEKWEESIDKQFEGERVYRFKDLLMVTIKQLHLFFDDIDVEVKTQLNMDIDNVIFASKHTSASGKKTLTVHPIGNFIEAKFGGKPGELVPSSPHLMTQGFRNLYDYAKKQNFDYSVTFEATHHGPYLKTPSFYIEIGSDDTAWGDEKAGHVIAQTILSLADADIDMNYPVAVGVGGGHYAPRISDVARSKQIAFGHIVPTYALEMPQEGFKRTITDTKGASIVYFHRKAMKKSEYTRLSSWFQDQQVRAVREKDLEDI